MRPDSFTVKVQEALEAAQRIARERGHQALKPAHVFRALLDDAEGVAPALLAKLGTDVKLLGAEFESAVPEDTQLVVVIGADYPGAGA